MSNQMLKIGLGSTVALAIAAGSAFAADEVVDVEAQFRLAIALLETSPVNFTPGTGSVDYTDVANINNTVDFVTLGTDGGLTAVGRLSSSLTAGAPGEVSMTGDPSTSVDISCTSAGMALSDGLVTLLDFVEARISVDATGAGDPYAAPDSVCAGVGVTPFPFTLDAGGLGIVTIGGRVNPVANMPSGIYTTANTGSGGVPITLRVVYTP